MQRFILIILLYLFIQSCSTHKQIRPIHQIVAQPIPVQTDSNCVVLGNENLLSQFTHLVKNKRVGLVTNPSGVNRNIENTADLLSAHPDINLTALFGPEHGIRGAVYAGEKIKDEIDPGTGLPVFSLYGSNRKPTADMLEDIDVLIVDIQDIGVRAYTYIYTMAKVMEAAAEHDKQVIVLDRPNPLGGLLVEGNLVEKGYFSFVGMYPIPYRHGMTIGELANYFNTEYSINCNLTVIPLSGWKREMLWDATNLPWIPPSPHVPHWQTVLFMSSTGTFGELHTLSEGVGYTSPFEIVGAPWINGAELAQELNNLSLAGVIFRPLYYKPYYGLFKGELCQGVQIHLTDATSYKSYINGFHIMSVIRQLYPDHNLFSKSDRVKMFNKVVGCNWIVRDLQNNVPVLEIESKWLEELNAFIQIRQKYLIYK